MGMVMYKLLDFRKDEDSFFINADGTLDNEKKLDFTTTRGILNPFFVTNKLGIREYKRYIAGCGIYDPAEQDKQRIVANRANSVVQIEKGAPIVLDEEKGKVLIDWLDMHPFNTTSVNHDPSLHDAVFFKYDPKAILQKELDNVGAEDEAMDILRMLRKSPERMKAVAMVFQQTANLNSEEEIYLALRKVAMEHPVAFKDSIANKENEVLSDVLKGLKYNIIGKDAKGYYYEADKTLLHPNIVKEQKLANGLLVAFLMSKEGDIHYRQLLIKIQQKEIELNAPEQ